MNFYMLVKGKSSEMKVYPKLISYYKPGYKRVADLQDIDVNSYYMFSGNGMPSLYTRIQPSLDDIAEFNRTHKEKIEEFIICLDTDYYGDEDKTYFRITQEISKCNNKDEIQFDIIMQTNCLETWFLGNRSAYPAQYGDDFKNYACYYNVSVHDPEKMKPPTSSLSIGAYSKQYLKKMLNESGMTYSVSNVRYITTNEYIAELNKRYKDTNHIKSFGYFEKFMARL